MRKLKKEDFSDEEMRKCYNYPLHFYNEHYRIAGESILTQEQYDAMILKRELKFSRKQPAIQIKVYIRLHPLTFEDCLPKLKWPD